MTSFCKLFLISLIFQNLSFAGCIQLIQDFINPPIEKQIAEIDNLVLRKKFAQQYHLEQKSWKNVKSKFLEKLKLFRKLKKRERKKLLTVYSSEVEKLLLEKTKSNNLGVHFNLHGGQFHGYLNAGGIRATQGDMALEFGSGSLNHKVYFFRMQQYSLFDILDSKNPAQIFSGRMGSGMIIFDLNHPYFELAQKSKKIIGDDSISIDFDPKLIKNNIGIPLEAFSFYPISIFTDVGKNVGKRFLSRDEETLAVLMFLADFFKRV